MDNKNDSLLVTTFGPQIITIHDKKELYKCYMPFIKGGGLFLSFNEEITPELIVYGQKILILLSLFDSKEKIPISGIVVWISRGNPYKGFGISLGDEPSMKSLKENIESITLDYSIRKEATYTL